MTPEQESRLHELAMDYRCAHVASASPRWKDVYAYVDSLIAAERAACEKVCMDHAAKLYDHAKGPYEACAATIRARGRT